MGKEKSFLFCLGLPIKVIIRNENLDLSISATTCHLYFNYTNVQFYTVNFTELFLDTPVAGIEGILQLKM